MSEHSSSTILNSNVSVSSSSSSSTSNNKVDDEDTNELEIETTHTTGGPPRGGIPKMDISSILTKDTGDESLERYKRTLIASGKHPFKYIYLFPILTWYSFSSLLYIYPLFSDI
jgi:hypothetical protein